MFLFDNTIESTILKTLAKNPASTQDILKCCLDRGFSQAGIYKILKILREKEIIYTHSKTSFLHPHFLQKLHVYSQTAHQTYLSNLDSAFDPRLLQQNSSFSKRYLTLLSLEQAWAYYYAFCVRYVANDQPFFTYQLHDWVGLLRPSAENLDNLKTEELGRYRIDTIGKKTRIGKSLKNSFYQNKRFITYDFIPKPITNNPRYHVNIFGNILIESYIDLEVAEAIDTFFSDETKTIADADELRELVFTKPGKYRLKISHNEKKATQLKKKIAKYFYIPSPDEFPSQPSS